MGFLALLGVIVAGIWGSIRTISAYLLEAMKKLWDLMLYLFDKYNDNSPRWLKWLTFILILSLVGGTVTSFVLSFKYACTSEDELREAQSTLEGISLFWELTIENAGLNNSGRCEVAYGAFAFNCFDVTDETVCEMFENASWASGDCEWDEVDSECDGFLWKSFSKVCGFMNKTQCYAWGDCDWKNYSISDDFVTDRTNPVVSPSQGSAEDMLRISCIGQTPRLTLYGLDMFNYRYWMMIMLITFVFSLKSKKDC